MVMIKAFIAFLAVAVACGAASDCPVACEFNFEPLCGSDGKTYTNECVFRMANCENPAVSMAYAGPCDDDDLEMDITEEDFDAAAGRKADCQMMCPMMYSPVCASNGQTFDNECQLKVFNCEHKSKFTTVKKGVCAEEDEMNAMRAPSRIDPRRCPGMCAASYAPVCASNGKTFENECMLKRYNCLHNTHLTFLYMGACDNAENDMAPARRRSSNLHKRCRMTCPFHYEPVCGSNGNTYMNKCLMKLAACEIKTKITMMNAGECNAEDNYVAMKSNKKNCQKPCPRIYRPICATNGQSYPNQCAMEIAQCEKPKDNIKFARNGNCNPEDDFEPMSKVDECDVPCSFDYSPVCGSNGETYANECLLKNAMCRNPAAQLSMAHFGECDSEEDETVVKPLIKIDTLPMPNMPNKPMDKMCENICTTMPMLMHPVCGSNGVTYNSQCELIKASCYEERVIAMDHEGPCGDFVSEH